MLLLARHGRTAYNAEGRFQGRAAVALDPLGREQAFALAERLADRGDVVRLVASPLARALETAAIVAARLGLAPEVDGRLAETDTGDWSHRRYDDVTAEAPEDYAAFRRLDLGFGAPGGETFGAQLERCEAVVADLRAGRGGHRGSLRPTPEGDPGATAVDVVLGRTAAPAAEGPAGRPFARVDEGATVALCHGNVIRLLLRAAHGEAPDHAGLGNTDVHEL